MGHVSVLRYGIVLVLVALGGCGDEATPAGPSSPSSPPETTVTQSAGPAGVAVADLAKRLSVDAGQIKVVSVDEVTWSDASLGCPKPGMMYAQVLVDGTRIVLEANGKRYEYHSGQGRAPFFCENPSPPAR